MWVNHKQFGEILFESVRYQSVSNLALVKFFQSLNKSPWSILKSGCRIQIRATIILVLFFFLSFLFFLHSSATIEQNSFQFCCCKSYNRKTRNFIMHYGKKKKKSNPKIMSCVRVDHSSLVTTPNRIFFFFLLWTTPNRMQCLLRRWSHDTSMPKLIMYCNYNNH